MEYKKGDRFLWPKGSEDKPFPLEIVLLRVAKDGTWADTRCTVGPESWTKRQPLPFDPSFSRQD